MKKMKYVGIAAAALLTISALAPAMPVQAASTSTTTTASRKAPVSTTPSVTYNGVTYTQNANITLANNASFNYCPVNSVLNLVEMQKAFQAPAGNTVSFDTSAVDTTIAAIYPVTATVTNDVTGNSIHLYFNLTVGNRNAHYQTVKGSTDTSAVVYEEQDGNLVDTGHAIQLDTQVATYGEKTIQGKQYTRLNSSSSDKYVLSGWFNGAYTSKSDATTKYLMHAALIYNKDLTKSGKKFRQFRNIDVYSEPETLSNGKKYYRLVDTWYYVNAANVDGTARVLKKNAYVYATGSKRANKKVLKKGSVVVTYGSSFKFKNGKRYFRIGKGKQYVRTANFE